MSSKMRFGSSSENRVTVIIESESRLSEQKLAEKLSCSNMIREIRWPTHRGDDDVDAESGQNIMSLEEKEFGITERNTVWIVSMLMKFLTCEEKGILKWNRIQH